MCPRICPACVVETVRYNPKANAVFTIFSCNVTFSKVSVLNDTIIFVEVSLYLGLCALVLKVKLLHAGSNHRQSRRPLSNIHQPCTNNFEYHIRFRQALQSRAEPNRLEAIMGRPK